MKSKRPDNFWASIDNTLAEAKSILKEHKLEKLPCANTLRKLGHSSLAMSICTDHGGYRKFRALLGENSDRPNGEWISFKYTLKRTKEIMKHHDFETLPGQETLNNLGYFGLVYSIHKYHGGFGRFRIKANLKTNVKPKGYWKSPENVANEVNALLKENKLTELPNTSQLLILGHSSLASAITARHGGIRSYRKKLKQNGGQNGQ